MHRINLLLVLLQPHGVFLHLENQTISACQGSRYIANEPFLLPDWLINLAVSLYTFNMGINPFDFPPVFRI